MASGATTRARCCARCAKEFFCLAFSRERPDVIHWDMVKMVNDATVVSVSNVAFESAGVLIVMILRTKFEDSNNFNEKEKPRQVPLGLLQFNSDECHHPNSR